MLKLNFLKNIINKLRASKEQKSLFCTLEVGDLVWAKMPLKNEELKAIEESHRIRPYLIAWKDTANIYAFQTSSKESKALNNFEKYCINKLRYKKAKDTWVELNKIYKVSVDKLKRKFVSLNVMDLKAIEKRLKIQKNRNKNIEYTFDLEIFISDGDVILKNGIKYYIYANDNTYVYGYKIMKKARNSEKDKKVIINKKRYYIDICEKFMLKRSNDIFIIDIASNEEKELIRNIKNNIENKREKLEAKTKEVYELGTVFKAGNTKFMYLFEENGMHFGVDLLMYQFSPKVVQIYNVEQKEIVSIYGMEEKKRVLEFLVLKCAKPYGKIKSLYDEIVE